MKSFALGPWACAEDFDLEEDGGRELLGGKATNLFRLKRWGHQVPEFGVLTRVAYEEWKQAGRLSPATLEMMNKSIASWPCHTNATSDSRAERYFAVRSSMGEEDGKDASYAGLLETFLYVPFERLEEYIYRCFQSAQSGRVALYQKRMQNKQTRHPDRPQSFAVIIQSMLDPAVSGVAFSRSPMGNSALMLIESVYGLGEGLVSGQVEVDSYYLDRFGNTHKEIISTKTQKLAFDNTLQVVSVPVPQEEQQDSSLSPDEILQLHALLLSIEQSAGESVDIEWAIERKEDQSKIYLLQVRPITQEFPPLDCYIDTNLSESYPGLTSPLTGDFVNRVYEKVYFELGELLGFSRKRQENLRSCYKKLVQYWGGHLYYHLPSYYHILASLPGGKKNIQDWHQMIGGRIDGSVEKNIVGENSLTTVEKTRFYWTLFKLIFFHSRIYTGFCRKAEKRQQFLLKRAGETDDLHELITLLEQAIRQNSGFALTALNDYLIMLSMRLLTKLLQRNGLEERWIPNLIRTKAGVESLRPLEDMQRLLYEIPHDLADVNFQTGQWEAIFDQLYKKGHNQFAKALKDYLRLYGDRSFEELKLECLTFNQSPSSFFELLFALKRIHRAPNETSVTTQAPFPWEKIGLIDKIFLKTVLSFAHRFIAMREKTRLLRGKYFGWVRMVLLKIFDRFKCQYPFDLAPFTVDHFFGLKLEHLDQWNHGGMTLAKLKLLLNSSHEWRQWKRDFPEFFCHPRESEGTLPPYFLEEHHLGRHSQGTGPASLQGTGASQGKVRGEVMILLDPREALKTENLDRKILVTKTTDPAWVYIMAQCRGLISEKGSLLSHTAIIGRELGVPTVVGVKKALQLLKDGQEIILDGQSGRIEIILAPERE